MTLTGWLLDTAIIILTLAAYLSITHWIHAASQPAPDWPEKGPTQVNTHDLHIELTEATTSLNTTIFHIASAAVYTLPDKTLSKQLEDLNTTLKNNRTTLNNLIQLARTHHPIPPQPEQKR